MKKLVTLLLLVATVFAINASETTSFSNDISVEQMVSTSDSVVLSTDTDFIGINSSVLIPDTACTGCPPRPHNKWVHNKPVMGRTGTYSGDGDLQLGFIDWFYDEITDTYFGEYTPIEGE